MEILQVVAPLVVTRRVPGLKGSTMRVLQDSKGQLQVAVDPVGARIGNWVFTISGSAARYALDDPEILTDLTIGGIIDYWDDPDTLYQGKNNRESSRESAEAGRSAA